MSILLTSYKFAEKRRAAAAAAQAREKRKQKEQDQQSVYQEPQRTWKQFTCKVSAKEYVISLCMDTLEILIGNELIPADIIFDDVNCSATLRFAIADKHAEILVKWLENSTEEHFYLIDSDSSFKKEGGEMNDRK